MLEQDWEPAVRAVALQSEATLCSPSLGVQRAANPCAPQLEGRTAEPLRALRQSASDFWVSPYRDDDWQPFRLGG
jgi:hypothetical protein